MTSPPGLPTFPYLGRHAARGVLYPGLVLVAFLTLPSAWETEGVRPPADVPAWGLDAGILAEEEHPPPEIPLTFAVTVTGYSSTRDQTDTTPFITASNTRVRPGVIALSRDFLRRFTPGAPFAFGDRVELEGLGWFLVEDTMAPRFRKRADIWFPTRAAARRWGRKSMNLIQVLPFEALATWEDVNSSGLLIESLLAD